MDNKQNRRPQNVTRKPTQTSAQKSGQNGARRPSTDASRRTSADAARRAKEREKKKKQARLLRVLLIIVCAILVAIIAIIAISCSKKKNGGAVKPDEQTTTEEVVTEPTKSTVELVAVGDVLMHTPLLNYADNGDGTYDFNNIFSVMKDDISRADIAVCTQEIQTKSILVIIVFISFLIRLRQSWMLRSMPGLMWLHRVLTIHTIWDQTE